MAARWFYGWNVVAAVFVMAMLSFGLGCYGVTVYVATLQRLHGWSAAAVSAPITVYYVGGALVTMLIGGVYARLGPRIVVAGGGLALAAGVAALGRVTEAWLLYPVFLTMSLGWGALSGVAVNIILAPWWKRRRGLGRQPGVQRRDAGRRGDRPGVAVAHRSGRLRACPGMESGFGQQPGLGSATSDSGRSGR